MLTPDTPAPQMPLAGAALLPAGLPYARVRRNPMAIVTVTANVSRALGAHQALCQESHSRSLEGEVFISKPILQSRKPRKPREGRKLT